MEAVAANSIALTEKGAGTRLEDACLIHLKNNLLTANTEEILAAKADLVIASVPYRMESLAAILKSSLPILAVANRKISEANYPRPHPVS
ncbi:MAG: hypothetical protein ABSA39_20865 [Edaphobacter sp.]